MHLHIPALPVRRTLLGAALALACACAAATAQAAVAHLDSFHVTKNGGTLFFDDFADGIPPPASPVVFNSGPAVYTHLQGTFVESAGKLVMNTDTGTISTSATGMANRVTRATLATNTSDDPAFLPNGLKVTHTFSVTGVFDLEPLPAGSGYAVRLVDRRPTGFAAGVSNDFVELQLWHSTSGTTSLRFREQDFIAGTNDIFDQVALASVMPAGAQQIALTLARNDLGSNAVTASFAFLAGGVVIGGGTFAPTIDIFEGESYTRAEFILSAPVPEPRTWATMALGLGLLGWRLRRRRPTPAG